MNTRIKQLIVAIALLSSANTASAQWFWRTQQDRNLTTISNTTIGLADMIIGSVERARQEKLYAQEKERMYPEFIDKQELAEDAYKSQDWSKALPLYCDLARLNDHFNWSFGDQGILVSRITECAKNSNHKVEGPSVYNNDKITLSDYSKYTRNIENPVYTCSKKEVYATITRVCANNKETRVEMEFTNPYAGSIAVSIKGKTYIKGKKSGKLELLRVENLTLAPKGTDIEFGKQTLRFALTFPALSPEDAKFDFTEPSSKWKYKDIKIGM